MSDEKKKIARLALAQLEKELSLLPQVEWSQVLGGSGSDLGSNPTIEDVVSYFEGLGMPFYQDLNGDYHLAGGILIEPVDIIARVTGSGFVGRGPNLR